MLVSPLGRTASLRVLSMRFALAGSPASYRRRTAWSGVEFRRYGSFWLIRFDALRFDAVRAKRSPASYGIPTDPSFDKIMITDTVCSVPEHGMMACPGCDLLHYTVQLPPGASARCRRCGHKLYTHKLHGIEYPLALTLASSIFFILANVFPFIAIEVRGITMEISVLSAAVTLFLQGMPLLGAFAVAVIFVFPLFQLTGMLMVLIPLYRGIPTTAGRRALRLVSMLAPWNMLEIYLIGALISLIKLSTYADVTLGIAFWNFIALVVTKIWAAYAIDKHDLWQRMERLS
uniref:Paraquat-inducible protein A n=1 Tax=Candidatus Kentrum sp. FM TaxID=2126340 RepID=A0A450SPR2_9GAMM|nr:MAG: Paraquat-inducible protein A [Candidatus Kentron sp. FM]VFJ55837.1 MAG: Paraquat-inducible protein A [Candidatus Kentron sp. FM]